MGHISALRASVLSAMAAGQDGYAGQVLALPPTGEVFAAMAAQLGITVG